MTDPRLMLDLYEPADPVELYMDDPYGQELALSRGLSQPFNPYETQNISQRLQEALGTAEPDKGGLAKDILSSRFDTGPSFGDYAQGVVNSALGKPQIGSSNGIKDQLSTILALQKLGQQPSAVQTYEYYNNLPSEQRQVFQEANRSSQWRDAGDAIVNPATGQRIQKGAPPQDMPGFKADVTAATKTADANVDRQTKYTQAQSALVGLKQQGKLVTDTIDKALGVIKKPGSFATGYGQFLSDLPNTDSRELNNYLDTIKSNIGFDKLQQMRQNSPTGGALGNVSDMENRLLQAVNGALDPKQGDQLVQNLTVIKQLYPQVIAERERAFNQDYGNTQPLSGNPQPIGIDPADPRIAKAKAAGYSDEEIQQYLQGGQ